MTLDDDIESDTDLINLEKENLLQDRDVKSNKNNLGKVKKMLERD